MITSSATAQTADPRSDFLNALGQFSLALDGTYGDEGQRLSTALDSMSAALSQWDALIQSRERAMAAEIGSAATIDRLEIRWPNGQMDTVAGVAANQIVTITEGKGVTANVAMKRTP